MNPQIGRQARALQERIEARKAELISESMEEYALEEKKITSQFDHDPIAKLRSRELDIRAVDNEKKRQEAETRLNLERMKAMMNQNIQEEKMDQNEDLAELRAETSLEKQEMANEAREKLARMKPRGGQ